MLARTVQMLVARNSKWAKVKNKKTGAPIGKQRPIVSNMIFSKAFEQYAHEKGVPIQYWENTEDLIKLSDCDVVIDEVGNYFDSRLWADLSLDARRWLTQGSKTGVEIYGAAQDFAQIDKSFRRLVNHLIDIRKICGSARPSATKPPVKRIWGICFKFNMQPQEYDEEKKSQERGIIPSGFFFIRKRDCAVFDTGQRIKRSELPPYRHMERRCELHEKSGGDGTCRFCKVLHE